MLGHDGPPTNYWEANLITGETLERCPLRTLMDAPSATLAEALRYADTFYPAYQDGFLLQAGGIADQPARYVELVQITQRYDRMVQVKWDELRPKED